MSKLIIAVLLVVVGVVFGQLPPRRVTPLTAKPSIVAYPATVEDYQRVIKTLEEERGSICIIIRNERLKAKSENFELPSICRFDSLPNAAMVREKKDRQAEVNVCGSWGMSQAGARPGWCHGLKK